MVVCKLNTNDDIRDRFPYLRRLDINPSIIKSITGEIFDSLICSQYLFPEDIVSLLQDDDVETTIRANNDVRFLICFLEQQAFISCAP
jgi:hypothetical protein